MLCMCLYTWWFFYRSYKIFSSKIITSVVMLVQSCELALHSQVLVNSYPLPTQTEVGCSILGTFCCMLCGSQSYFIIEQFLFTPTKSEAFKESQMAFRTCLGYVGAIQMLFKNLWKHYMQWEHLSVAPLVNNCKERENNSYCDTYSGAASGGQGKAFQQLWNCTHDLSRKGSLISWIYEVSELLSVKIGMWCAIFWIQIVMTYWRKRSMWINLVSLSATKKTF